ncbi:hypothetical protein PARMER_00668 [Parabacteroides merdae ATCC 43184]|nr:hypothetical protein PARMER_02658 [Parabacteroides merdae ATCC 43184]EDN87920.1 hypothetical protein PARMER_00668 [Parabacteroides merdae ATCC 43184]
MLKDKKKRERLFIYHDLLDTDFTDKLFYFRVIRT